MRDPWIVYECSKDKEKSKETLMKRWQSADGCKNTDIKFNTFRNDTLCLWEQNVEMYPERSDCEEKAQAEKRCWWIRSDHFCSESFKSLSDLHAWLRLINQVSLSRNSCHTHWTSTLICIINILLTETEIKSCSSGLLFNLTDGLMPNLIGFDSGGDVASVWLRICICDSEECDHTLMVITTYTTYPELLTPLMKICLIFLFACNIMKRLVLWYLCISKILFISKSFIIFKRRCECS